jgi:GDPmannose 4,6-dehydratase
LKDFVATAFSHVGLHWEDHVVTDRQLYRPSDISWSQGDAKRAKMELQWEAKVTMPALVGHLVDAAMQLAK